MELYKPIALQDDRAIMAAMVTRIAVCRDPQAERDVALGAAVSAWQKRFAHVANIIYVSVADDGGDPCKKALAELLAILTDHALGAEAALAAEQRPAECVRAAQEGDDA